MTPSEPSSETGPYTDAEFDEHFRRTLRSDWLYVANRLVVIAVVFWLMGRAIRVHDLSAGFLLLPLGVEFLLAMWVGQILSWTVVDCKAFAQTAKPGLVVFWSLLIPLIVSIVLAVDEGTFDLSRVGPGWVEGWHKVFQTGLLWAFVAGLVSLVVSTIPEVRRWKRDGGRFLWTSIFDLALRLVGVLLLGMAAFFLLVVLADVTGGWLSDRPSRAAWFVWGFLLCVEVGALALGVKIHRDLVGKDRNEAG